MRPLIASLLLLTACAHKPPVKPYAGTLDWVLSENPLADGEKIKVTVLSRSEDATVQIIQLRKDVPAHIHAHSQETVQLLRGRGRMMLDGKEHPAIAGSVFIVPKGTPHAFFLTSEDAAALSVFSPPFRPGDRVPVH